MTAYIDAARSLGVALARRKIGLVYGGANIGLMGVLANSVLNEGGSVTGVVPRSLKGNIAHLGLSELHVVRTMHQRKTLMYELSDGYIALPGGLGTLEEILEVITWAQLGYHEKPCAFLNVCGYFTHLLEFMDYAVTQQFIKQPHREMVIVDHDPDALIDAMSVYCPPKEEKWPSKIRG